MVDSTGTVSPGDTGQREKIYTSHSGLTTHRRCPQAWHYAYMMRLERVSSDPPVERDFGSWWHAVKAADTLQRGLKLDSLRKAPDKVGTVEGGPTFDVNADLTVAHVLDTLEGWWGRLPGDIQDEWVSRLGEEPARRAASIYDRWREEWREEIERERPLAFEMGWKRTLPRVDGDEDSPDVVLVGYVDEIYLDSARNIVVVRDTKTSKTLGTQSAADDMMDSQLQLYAWGAAPEVAKWEVGKIAATAYDRVRTTKPKEPVVTMAGTLSKSITDFDLHTYLEFCKGPDGQGVPFPGRKKDGSGAGFYTAEEAVIERLSTPSARSAWLQRTLVPLSSHIVRAHLRAAVDSAQDQYRTRKRAEVMREGARNLTSNCRWCDFASLCRAQMVGGAGGDYDLAVHGLRERPAG